MDNNKSIPRKRQEVLKWNGWGYQDTYFYYRDNQVGFTGDRYPLGNIEMPYFTEWIKEKVGVDFDARQAKQMPLKPEDYPKPLLNDDFMNFVAESNIPYSIEGDDRLFRAHGHTLHDIYVLRTSVFPRVPDLVVWPSCHDDVVKIVKGATDCNVVIIPFGGGTSVSGALECSPSETRMIVSLDTSQMNQIVYIDQQNLTAVVESGMIGQDLERQLQKHGYTTGHEPDSYEFSSVGGWVATRASGMKKNVYGNIEDLLVHVKMVTPVGVIEKACQVPRMSCGPDIHHIVLGSEGTLGVITDVTLKIRPLPECKKYGSIVFPNFESGVLCMREVARQRCQPASIRLMDNEQFHFGQALRPVPNAMGMIKDRIKMTYLTWMKGFDPNQLCVMTLVFEGTKSHVEMQEKQLYSIASEFHGIPAGDKNGQRGYNLTFVIAYIRDLALDFGVVGESFETSVPWDRTLSLCHNVKHRVKKECSDRGIKHCFISCRVTQTYDAGACIYFYFAFNYTGMAEDPTHLYDQVENAAREEILACGGSISHHHGIGKIRKQWVGKTLTKPSVEVLRAVKKQLDPLNIFANGNVIDPLQSKL